LKNPPCNVVDVGTALVGDPVAAGIDPGVFGSDDPESAEADWTSGSVFV
jgi:hypothetical protein